MIITSVMMIMIEVAGDIVSRSVHQQWVRILGGRQGHNVQYQTWIMSTHFPSAFLSQALYIG